MKVLFVGEGNHDIGGAGKSWGQPRPARGVVPMLAHRVCPSIQIEGVDPAASKEGDSIALAWHDISRFSPKGRRGFEGKVAAAMLVSSRKFGCAGTVCVSDQDGDSDRLGALLRGKQGGVAQVRTSHAIAVGVAVESIEAWTLGAPEAVAEELDVHVSRVRAVLPGKHVESLRESSGKEEHRPKPLIGRLAALAHREDSTEMRCAVAARTDVTLLRSACPEGFDRFAEELRRAFP
ncbi:MAG: hypothetical protein ABJE95_07930 [Byssovorax sp.]